MDKVTICLTVFFDEPFWVGVFERIENGKISVTKVTFGSEPKESEVDDYIQGHAYRLRYSPSVETVVKDNKKNPKRIQREARKHLINTGIGTKSQQALKLQQEQLKSERSIKSREQKDAKQERIFELKQKKRKEKHRGH